MIRRSDGAPAVLSTEFSFSRGKRLRNRSAIPRRGVGGEMARTTGNVSGIPPLCHGSTRDRARSASSRGPREIAGIKKAKKNVHG
ncbi:hypothetical protein PUN28_006792 [Cardiocondyla obscurior]|uniref:Uncharacterized protein n=1 Tax=Cardiocondyla obscurior TaxID=286306 RepID=A0AAW2G0B8_9HYME